MSDWKRDPITDPEELKTLRISPSSINSFRQCPRKWHYTYILALEQPPTVHLIRGNIVHHVLENVFKQKYVPSGEAFRPHMLDTAKKLFDKEWKNMEQIELSEEENTMYYDESWNMIKRFFTRFCNNIQEGIRTKKFANETQGYYFTKPTFKELWIDDEYKIQFNEKLKSEYVKKEDKVPFENTLNVGGFIDSVQKDFDNNVILVDYKTSSKYQNVLSEEYTLQLAIYAYLWEKQTGTMPAFVAINYLKYDETFYIMVTPSLINEAKTKIKNMRSALIEFGLDESKYYAKESKLCDWCPYKDRCVKNEVRE